MRKYEILVILNPTIDSTTKEKAIKTLEEKIGGKIVSKDDWGTKKLAYPIKKEKEGHYVLYYVETEGSRLAEVTKYFNVTKAFLRHVIINHDDKFPFEKKTLKDVKFPERKPRAFGDKPFSKRPYDPNRKPFDPNRPKSTVRKPRTEKPAGTEDAK